jgi:hypothetical protein
MKIFIAGCARSGTSLTRRLMNYFADTFVFRPEAPVARFADLHGPEAVKVIKRTAACYRYLPMLPGDVELLYCIRHPFDVLTSRHQRAAADAPFHVSQSRWSAEYDAFHKLREQQPDRRIFCLRYEDLIVAPDATQRRLAAFFNLSPTTPFSDHTISSASIEKWRHRPELRDFIEALPTEFMRAIEGFCREFGYDCDLTSESPGARQSQPAQPSVPSDQQ